ncbi:MAG TPA: glutamate-cysteine ligase family protein [Candidatus Gastranaerophilaceae bacterium]|nr:glutamate-cysteine ligase family protein [Candidatus Gastranaerophilaceae bacterium]HPT41014.1 glutamate-cysteine ligase family protein [Candidatus Gastranaerophilaceae bacterium]
MLKSKDETILSVFKKGCKPKEEYSIGVEYERLPIHALTYKSVGYEGENGIYELLRAFSKLDNWEYITDDYNIIGLKKGEDLITLEPGCQFELSLKPEKNIADLKTKIDNFNKKITPLLRRYDINLLEYGVSPVSTYKSIKIIPKKRYHIMANYLWGILSDVMMRETAGIQACFDFSSEKDAIRKFRVTNMLSPFMTAMFANSPIRGSVDTGYKTFRGLSWLNTDSERCGFLSKKFFEKNSDYGFEDYIKDVMKTPMIFIMREGNPVKILGKIDFEQFIERGFDGFEATLDDFLLHANLCFPEVRLRDFIEIRNHDCANHGMQYAILGIYKGILYSQKSLEEAEELVSNFSYNDIAEFRYNVPKNALETKIKGHFAKDIAKEILKISQKSLKEQGLGEEKFLDSIAEYTLQGLCPADVILKNWYGSWNKDINKLMKYLNN